MNLKCNNCGSVVKSGELNDMANGEYLGAKYHEGGTHVCDRFEYGILKKVKPKKEKSRDSNR